ncbi:dihydroorotate dehydrogenase electron transfer subunit [Desulforhabdus amnigena]|jgi:dihydroorotate dehydrogenase electron transfer subunit|uniref:Dihydroorotate dehydrogenase B (NAD(+)), electron transfer subunit n=1 Tax=Desulforhabdus amnigena TaxID=40218 RepID=A0A9W6L822_9BACT|nr:dihydroorotate dehydrogenase electron transfer subunit [Desulforhabdus amnigena]NLJ29078.1 dihydroorotate dehydrogenase electron transfer subunit [Deltaproteobacteria bacterium]GLI35187.1 dihydroorotate dehydrogenase B (NAD(+)), electron transfer subunit [Desulforhabdus amnigena]
MSKFLEEALILEQREVAQQTYRLRLRAGRMAEAACAGQFFMLQVREGMDPLLRRPFSFHRIHPGEGNIEVLYRVVGRGTWWLSRCAPQTRLNLLGPLGNGFQLPRNAGSPVAIVAGGIGIAPLCELIHRLLASRGTLEARDIHLFYGARSAGELLPESDLEDLGISVYRGTDDGSLGYDGFVTDLFRKTAEEKHIKPSVLYACGPLAMQYHVARWALEHRVPSQLSLESLMACGIGACLGCALPASAPAGSTADHYVHVCKDGPIFGAESIQWHKIQTHGAPPPIFLYS